jgi:hypothetical protein
MRVRLNGWQRYCQGHVLINAQIAAPRFLAITSGCSKNDTLRIIDAENL